MLRDFESRRKSASSGHFVTDSALRQHENEMLSSIVGTFAGARLVIAGTSVLLYSARGSSGPAFSRPKPGGCPVVAYEDGIFIGEGPDVGNLRVSDYSAIEFYESPAEVPTQYNRTGNGCGVILLWRRQRP